MLLSKATTFLGIAILIFSPSVFAESQMSPTEKLAQYCFNSSISTYGNSTPGATFPEAKGSTGFEIFPGIRDNQTGLYVLAKGEGKTKPMFVEFTKKARRSLAKKKKNSKDINLRFKVDSVSIEVAVHYTDGKLVAMSSLHDKSTPTFQLPEPSLLNDTVDSKANSFQTLESLAVKKVEGVFEGVKRELELNTQMDKDFKERNCKGKKDSECGFHPLKLATPLKEILADIKRCGSAGKSQEMTDAIAKAESDLSALSQKKPVKPPYKAPSSPNGKGESSL